MLKLLRVSGGSLLPRFQDGDFVLVSKIPRLGGRFRQGDVIAFRNQTYGTLIKQVQSVSPIGDKIFVVGTQENSVDSRRFGAIGSGDVLGKVIWHIKKPSNWVG
jgi:signal peptidase I